VVQTGAHAGLAFDGDADRVVAVDEQGGIVDGDHILAIAAIESIEEIRCRGGFSAGRRRIEVKDLDQRSRPRI